MSTNESSVNFCDVQRRFVSSKAGPAGYEENILLGDFTQPMRKYIDSFGDRSSLSDATILSQDTTMPISVTAIGTLVLLLPLLILLRFVRNTRKKNMINNESTESRQRRIRKREFLARVGDEYGYRRSKMGYIDEWRPIELPSLESPLDHPNRTINNNDEREVYLDYAGASLPIKSQLEQICQESMEIMGNPHSKGPAAARTTEKIQQAQHRVLKHLDARPGKFSSLQLPETFHQSSTLTDRQRMDRHPGYEVLFTSGATQAFQTVADRFPWQSSSTGISSIFLYVTNSHNSVVGMRQLAMERGAKFHCLDLEELEQLKTIDDWKNLESTILSKDTQHKNVTNQSTTPKRKHLLVFPSECNFGGDRPDAKSIIQVARASGWYTMLDIAKHASTDAVSLNNLDPDFAALSFYKLFGAPTGIGALMVRRTAIAVLTEGETSRKHYQGGGSVDIMLPNTDYIVPRSSGLTSLQNGTSHFRGITSLVHGFDVLKQLGGMSAIHKHTSCLANELATILRSMKHSNGMPVVRLYGAWRGEERLTNKRFGPTVTLNVFRSDGSAVGYNEVAKLAALHNPPIQFRTGCFCNPGACQRALDLDNHQAIENYETNGHVCGDHIDLANGMPTGAVRISFGKDSIWEDLDAFVQFLKTTFQDNSTLSIDETKRIAQTELSTPVADVSVSELYIFPIKSCAAFRVSKWPLCLRSSGKLQYDREFAIVDTSGAALRMQTCPKLGLITPSIDLETQTMRVSAPGCKDLVIHLSDDLYHGGENAVRVCGNKCSGRVWGDACVSEWFSSFLGIQCWLARYSSAKDPSSLHQRPGFSNEQPILLVSESAVATLNGVLVDQGQTVCTAKRFRPNIVIRDTVAPNTNNPPMEDEWKTISLVGGNLNFSVEGGCPRCSMVDFDPSTGKKGKTLRALASYRRRNGHIVFGIFLRAVATTDPTESQQDSVWIQEGDRLECK